MSRCDRCRRVRRRASTVRSATSTCAGRRTVITPRRTRRSRRDSRCVASAVCRCCAHRPIWRTTSRSSLPPSRTVCRAPARSRSGDARSCGRCSPSVPVGSRCRRRRWRGTTPRPHATRRVHYRRRPSRSSRRPGPQAAMIRMASRACCGSIRRTPGVVRRGRSWLWLAACCWPWRQSCVVARSPPTPTRRSAPASANGCARSDSRMAPTSGVRRTRPRPGCSNAAIRCCGCVRRSRPPVMAGARTPSTRSARGSSNDSPRPCRQPRNAGHSRSGPASRSRSGSWCS